MIKGTLKYVTGDATDPQKTYENEIVVIPHCCNNENIWGGGFVIALSKKWEKPEQMYREYCEKRKDEAPILLLGEVVFSKIDSHLVVANMIGQNGTITETNPKPIKYSELVRCMEKVVDYIRIIKSQTSNPVVIHAPKFGSLRAGGNFDFVLELIKEIWVENGIDVIIYEFQE